MDTRLEKKTAVETIARNTPPAVAEGTGMDAAAAHFQSVDIVLRTFGPIAFLRMLASRCRTLSVLADPAGVPPWPHETPDAIERAASALEASLAAPTPSTVPAETNVEAGAVPAEVLESDDQAEDDDDGGENDSAEGEASGDAEGDADELEELELEPSEPPPAAPPSFARSPSTPPPSRTEVPMKKDQIPIPADATHWRAWRMDPTGEKHQTALSHGDDFEEDEFEVRLLSKSRLRQWWGAGKYTVGFFQLLPTGKRKSLGRSRPIGIRGPGEGLTGSGSDAGIIASPTGTPTYQEFLQLQAMEREERRREREEDWERRRLEREEAYERDRLELQKLKLELQLRGAQQGSVDLAPLVTRINELTTMVASLQAEQSEAAAHRAEPAPAADNVTTIVNAIKEVMSPVLTIVAARATNDNAGPGLASATPPAAYPPRVSSGG